MEQYRTRNGVVLTTVCGEYLLVSARALHETSPFLTVINETSAFLWNKLKSGASAEDLECAVLSEYEVEDATQIRGMIDAFLTQMLDLHYVVKEDG